MSGKGRGKRIPSPKEQEDKKRTYKHANRSFMQNSQAWKNFSFGPRSTPLQPPTGSPSHSAQAHSPQGINYTYHPVASQAEMLTWCRGAMQDPNMQCLTTSLFEQFLQGPLMQVEDNTNRINMLENKVELQEKEMLNMKQDGMRKSLRFYNPDWKEPDSGREDTDQLITDFIQTKLNMPDFDQGFISHSHRSGRKKTDGTPRPIVCHFLSDRVRESVYSGYKDLPTGCSLNENLIGPLATLAYYARVLKKNNDISETWVRNGKIYAKHNESDRATVITSQLDLLKLVSPPVLHPDFTWQDAQTSDDMTPMKYIQLVRSGNIRTKFLDHSKATNPSGQTLATHFSAQRPSKPLPKQNVQAPRNLQQQSMPATGSPPVFKFNFLSSCTSQSFPASFQAKTVASNSHPALIPDPASAASQSEPVKTTGNSAPPTATQTPPTTASTAAPPSTNTVPNLTPGVPNMTPTPHISKAKKEKKKNSATTTTTTAIPKPILSTEQGATSGLLSIPEDNTSSDDCDATDGKDNISMDTG